MKKISLITLLILTACANPLDKVYEPLTYRTDYREIALKDSLNAFNIQYVILSEIIPAGQTYRDILNRYPSLRNEQIEAIRIEDSIAEDKRVKDSIRRDARIKARELLLVREEIKRKEEQAENARIRAAVRVSFIRILNEWGVKDVFKKAALEQFDAKYYIPDVEIESNVVGDKLYIYIGGLSFDTYIN